MLCSYNQYLNLNKFSACAGYEPMQVLNVIPVRFR